MKLRIKQRWLHTWQLTYNQIYRGYQWQITPTYIYALCRRQISGDIFKFGNFIDHAHLNGPDLAQAVHRQRNTFLPNYDVVSYDRVPWEIHEILDETAYASALAAYKAHA